MSHKNENHHKSGKFLDGFFWGAVLGGGAAYVLSTKKGREIVKELIQEAVDILENMAAPDEIMEAPQVVEDMQVMQEIQEPAVEPLAPEIEPTPKKSFFRRKKSKS